MPVLEEVRRIYLFFKKSIYYDYIKILDLKPYKPSQNTLDTEASFSYVA